MEQLTLEGGKLLLIVSPWGHSSQRVSRDLEVEQQTTKEDIFWRQIEMRELILVGLGL